jgi:uncharacterized membrane protein YdjX (TVP38/TMEM64 family)
MPSEYSSTARALASSSPLSSPTTESATRPSFTRNRSSRRRLSIRDARLPLQERLYRLAEWWQRKAFATYEAMTLVQRILAGLALLVLGVLGILFLIYNHNILEWLKPWVDKWRTFSGGWIIIFSLIFVCAFPPVIGYSTCLTICGMLYGFPHGWFVAAAANVIGSLVSFVVCRRYFSNYVHRLVGEDKRFISLASVLKHDGVKVLVMIRLCPLPYSLSNGAMSTFPTVGPAMFALATAMATPKLLIHVFIGSRLAVLLDTGDKMDMATRLVNYTSIVGGGLLGIGLGYYIYQRTTARARELELEEAEALAGAARRDLRDPSYFGGAGDSLDAAAEMNDDDISLWDNDEEGDFYRDDAPANGKATRGVYADEEAAIGSKAMPPR